MDDKKRFSPKTLIKRFGQSFVRFPVAMLLSLFLTCFLIYLCHGGSLGANKDFLLVFYPATGALLAVALSLLTEDFKSRALAVATQAVIHAAWLGISVYLAQIDSFSMPQLIAVAATVFAIGLAVFLICFYRKNQDLQFWNFSIRIAGALAVSVVIGGALALGLLLLVESLKMLFGLEFEDAVYGDIWAVCMCLLAPMLFMFIIPKGEDKYLNEAPEFSRFTQGVVQYLFMPLLGVYFITLYVYAAKILLQWSLPVGGVSYLVSGSMVLMILLIYVTYPVQHLEGRKLFKQVSRLLPVVMLPLLALMSVAIGRRLSDYGITVNRLYLLAFNVWCYAVCLWLIFARNKRIWLIPASFAVILFLISVGPQSIANVTKRHLLNEAQAAFMAAGFTKLPLSDEQYKHWADKADPEVVAAIDSKLYYLQSDFGQESINSLVNDNGSVGCYMSYNDDSDDGYKEKGILYTNSHLITGMAMPQGYSRMTLLRDMTESFEIEGEKVILKLRDNNGPEVYQFVIDMKLFKKFDENGTYQPGEPLTVKNDSAMLMFDYFRLWTSFRHIRDDEWEFGWDGILFTK